MNILIDASQVPLKKSGVGTYAVHLIRRVLATDKENIYYIVIQSDEKAFDDIQSGNCRFLKIPHKIFRRLICRFWLEQFGLPLLALIYKIKIIHSLHYSFPIIRTGFKQVVTIHDLTFFKFPHFHEPAQVRYFRFFTRLAIKKAHKLISVSQSTFNDLCALSSVARAKTTVIHHGIQMGKHHLTMKPNPNLLKDRFGIDGPFILFIGTREPRKNLSNLLMAFERLVRLKNEYLLVIVGARGWGESSGANSFKNFEGSDKVIFTDFVSESIKWQLLMNASLFVYPSFYEGFGMPVLEALSLGVPTITSNISALPEVSGDAAILVDPKDPEQISKVMELVLEDRALQKELARRSIVQAGNFSWAKTASATIAAYKSLF